MRRVWILTALLVALACDKGKNGVINLPQDVPPPVDQPREQPPVALNAQTPVEYPPALFDRGIEGTVILRLYTDSTGALVTDSTRVQESSGYPALDSAAVAASPELRFAPARMDGKAVSASFLQPIYFRHPASGGVTP